MTYTRIESLLDSADDIKLLKTLSNDNMDTPELISKIIETLSDGSYYAKSLDDNKLLSLFRLAREYFNSCWSIYLDFEISSPKLDKLIDYSNSIVYYVIAPDGERVATQKEVEQGVEQLIPKEIENISGEIKEHLNLLLWTFNGYLRYYRQAGLTYTYKEDKLDDTDYQLIVRAGQKLRSMIDWITVKGNYEKAIATLKLAKKNSKYKYPAFAQDEITAEISVKQIVYLCKKELYGNGATQNQIDAKKILFLTNKNKSKPLPHEVAILRRAYDEVKNGIVGASVKKLDTEVQVIIQKLKLGLAQGLTAADAFAFKIVDTISKTGECSEKQLNILLEEERKINLAMIKYEKSAIRAEDNKVDEAIEQELLDLSDALGSGILEV